MVLLIFISTLIIIVSIVAYQVIVMCHLTMENTFPKNVSLADFIVVLCKHYEMYLGKCNGVGAASRCSQETW